MSGGESDTKSSTSIAKTNCKKAINIPILANITLFSLKNFAVLVAGIILLDEGIF